ncbi:hypothetical protein [Catellatospora methionotrophica]|uniref:hypothetical protein n=1 Tax=Catellatospora methionotrophica TaxID=121620 RepID=UPI00140C3461|nr:hypothetical protein [Catellatospora methionotrophica]
MTADHYRARLALLDVTVVLPVVTPSVARPARRALRVLLSLISSAGSATLAAITARSNR